MIQKALKEKDFYKTADLALATAIYIFYPIEAIDFGNPQRVQFIFKRDNGLDELIEKYWRKELRVEPQAYFYALRSIKARLKEGLREIKEKDHGKKST